VVGRTAGRPSAETHLHLTVVQRRNAGAVLHTHSVWGTIVSDLNAEAGGVAIEGYEMLKGLSGVHTHEHREWVPVLENDQNMDRLAALVAQQLDDHPAAHGFLLRRHGLYTWGATLDEAERHVEILEFLLESVARRSAPWRE
jgi:methylthioribulose-1-phosphate dehydratase